MGAIGLAVSSGTSPSDGKACSRQHAYRQKPSNGSCTHLGPLPTTAHGLEVLDAACSTTQSAMRQRLEGESQTQTQTERGHLWSRGGALPQQYIGTGPTALGELHSDENLVAHEALRSNALVESAIATAWRACAQSASTLVREAYYTMARKLFLSVTLDGGEAPDPYECLRRLESEWTYDAGAKEVLTQEDVARCWFRLAGLHATAVSAEGYAEWILAKVHTIAQLRYCLLLTTAHHLLPNPYDLLLFLLLLMQVHRIAQPRFGQEGERDLTNYTCLPR